MKDDDAPPPMREALLDADGLAVLLRDIAAFGTIDEIVVKSGPGRVGDTTAPALEDVEALLATRQIRGVQIRYRHDGAQWWDTLLIVPNGVRLVRVRHDFGPPS